MPDSTGVGAQESTSFNEWVKLEAQKIGSDGCSVVSEWQHQCCLEHDLACHYGKDPEVAFASGWENAPKMSRKEADKRFWRCNRQGTGVWGKFRADLRYLGVRIGALTFWR